MNNLESKQVEVLPKVENVLTRLRNIEDAKIIDRVENIEKAQLIEKVASLEVKEVEREKS